MLDFQGRNAASLIVERVEKREGIYAHTNNQGCKDRVVNIHFILNLSLIYSNLLLIGCYCWGPISIEL